MCIADSRYTLITPRDNFGDSKCASSVWVCARNLMMLPFIWNHFSQYFFTVLLWFCTLQKKKIRIVLDFTGEMKTLPSIMCTCCVWFWRQGDNSNMQNDDFRSTHLNNLSIIFTAMRSFSSSLVGVYSCEICSFSWCVSVQLESGFA